MKHDLLYFKILVSTFEGWKGRHFYGRPRAALSLATPLFVANGLILCMFQSSSGSAWAKRFVELQESKLSSISRQLIM